MSTFINNNEFFTDGLVATVERPYKALFYNNEHADLMTEKKIYTLPAAKNQQRFKAGNRFLVSETAVIEPYTMFLVGYHLYSMGAFSSVNSILPVNTIIGRYSSIAHNLKRSHGNHPTNRFTTSMLTYSNAVVPFQEYLEDSDSEFTTVPHGIKNGSPIIIGNDVWVGQDVTFATTGITVGDGAIVAGGAWVTKDVPPYAIVGGVPAKVIKYRFPEDIIERLMKLKWWQYAYGDFTTVNADDDIETFLDKVEKLVEMGDLKPFQPEVATAKDFVVGNG